MKTIPIELWIKRVVRTGFTTGETSRVLIGISLAEESERMNLQPHRALACSSAHWMANAANQYSEMINGNAWIRPSKRTDYIFIEPP